MNRHTLSDISFLAMFTVPPVASFILAIFKLVGLLNLSWLWVTSPIWIVALFLYYFFSFIFITETFFRDY